MKKNQFKNIDIKIQFYICYFLKKSLYDSLHKINIINQGNTFIINQLLYLKAFKLLRNVLVEIFVFSI